MQSAVIVTSFINFYFLQYIILLWEICSCHHLLAIYIWIMMYYIYKYIYIYVTSSEMLLVLTKSLWEQGLFSNFMQGYFSQEVNSAKQCTKNIAGERKNFPKYRFKICPIILHKVLQIFSSDNYNPKTCCFCLNKFLLLENFPKYCLVFVRDIKIIPAFCFVLIIIFHLL